MSIAVLKLELDTDPLGRGYSGMSNAAAAVDLNTADIEVNIEEVSGNAIFEAADQTEREALSDANKALFYAIVGMDTIKVNGTNTKAALLAMFLAGTTTRDNLAVLQKQDVSRASQLGLGTVREGDVARARSI